MKRLITLLQSLRAGASLEEAREQSGLSRSDLEELFDETLALLRGSGRNPLHLVAYCDGASRGNPGQAAAAAIICDRDGTVLHRTSRLLGVATNNVAEYEAVLLALERAAQLRAESLVLKVDSELVANQLRGTYRVKNAHLQNLYRRARHLMGRFREVRVELVSRNENREADRMANKALDRRRAGDR